ncbi:MlaD family protein [Megasphaera paucivorans]|uniref:Phospholipid/cholesterol/gamma-HCH transport system substrate-binding protein n=1 Tax=Megasphaera paucivorans TaxID=349095 RepID=A0A1G9TDU4_9FIRM|nr:MlaD family protein [Megasphaera paucivorans]SDM45891.1 phospholipid/cholesterol/gamma-HCH transport system substrate-binding protein [Megasphaera paucivorans]
MKWTAEAKVGLVTVIGIIVFTYVILDLAHAEIFGKPGFEIHAVFADANGLKSGNAVRYVGVHVGKVESISTTKYGVDAKIKLDKGTEIPKDSKVIVATDGLLGEKIIQITPGEDSNHLLTNGDYIYGTAGQSMDDMMKSANTLMTSVNDMMKNVNAVIGDDKTQEAMRGTIRNSELLTGNMNAIVQGNAGNIQAITANMAAITTSMNNVASQLQQSAQTIDGDGVTSQNIRATAVNVKDITERVEKIAASMEKITNDPASQADLKTTLHNTAQISTKVNNILGNGKITVQGEAGMLYNDTKGESGANVNFKVYRDKSFALIGAESIGNGTALNLQYGYHENLFERRIGIINGNLGAGIDFGVNGPFRISLEGYDPNDWRYRIKAQYKILPNIYLFGQFTRPMGRNDGGNYYGVNYTF